MTPAQIAAGQYLRIAGQMTAHRVGTNLYDAVRVTEGFLTTISGWVGAPIREAEFSGPYLYGIRTARRRKTRSYARIGDTIVQTTAKHYYVIPKETNP